ncbi:MAG: hypothetical protein DLM52_06815 [Chthoniobacterales bacterium]|nr:MAG: hypothetical protein DLM52_06815 [Chthoniobacterales bacterium]
MREFVELLNSRSVEYVIVGAHSFAFEARPRFTGDLDILLRPSPENALIMMRVLKDFGFGGLDISKAAFQTPDQVIELGRAPLRNDLLTSITGVSVEEAFSTRETAEIGESACSYWVRTR